MSSKVPMTLKGSIALKEELHQLKSIERHKIIEAVATARAHGDLRENAEYHAARERQGFVEARIRDIEGKLSHAEVIDTSKLVIRDRVVFGATVTIADQDGKQSKSTYKIVGEDEANVAQKRISYTSPIARSIMGKQVGEDCIIRAPNGERHCVIVEVKYIAD